MNDVLQFAIWAVVITAVGYLVRPRGIRKWLGGAAFVAAWVLIFCFSSTKLVGFDLGILGICLVVLGVDLFVRRDRFSKVDE
ncbi:hypothetical protein IPC139_03155 [Pseudomonas aeruginosa]|uniref:Uncharacterized protein n=1 Tax=Pseudomonas aeruginosa TaxID=287 RepID=A0A643IYH2_PSEAI|nr:hypothetical protein [Pseudomonas aeruginosa]EKV4465219.1 hypothetical protein [Pseudomonas aeruginosa]ELQ7868445.1 hypothetical protein [Pseudomonas aeruginosa]KAB0762592.1 hypothetical protein F7O97_19190 [Pseudomonas aeruginosa]MBH8938871.1 hypothetical protein [Pseudomonas aeruginosa]MCW5394632.1 hypothetical protein [Pseudomonas aeruginosa]